MDAAGASSPMHVVICPWLAFGHLLPCLDLAQRLASRGHRVSFVSTPRNIARLPPLRPAAAPLVDFVALPLPRVEGLPNGAESTNDVPYESFELHRKAFDGLAAPFSEFLASACAGEDSKPDCVIVDIFHHWAAAAAIEHKVPCTLLLLGAASLVFERINRQPGRTEARVPAFESEKRKMAAAVDASGMSIAERFFLTLERSSLVAIRSCVEWEPEAMDPAATVRGKPVAPLGLLPPSPYGGVGGDPAVLWLDAQPANSVVYVALGSEVPLGVEQVHELALGLELAGARFLWALRKPTGVADDDVLPPGFEERTHGHGLVATGWVPQLSVLAHAAVAAFLTHCGWNSTIEGLLFGRPLIMLPISYDQGTNARLMEGRKVGVQVQRNDGDGSFEREGVAAAVHAVVVEEEGRSVFAANAKKWQQIVADRECHERYIDEFIQRLRSFRQ